MKRILFILSCIFCININANNTSNNVKFGNAVRNLKHYGFSFCLEQSYVDKKEKVYPPTRRLDLLSYDLRVSQQGSMKFAWIGGFKIQEQVAQTYDLMFLNLCQVLKEKLPQSKVTEY